MEYFKLAGYYEETNENGQYWTDGEKVYCSGYEIKGADINSFVQFPGYWAMDKKYCYSSDRKIKDADRETFKVLNYTYAKDRENVWTMVGKIKKADAETFEVCDNGKYSLGKQKRGEKIHELFSPYGYGKDKNNVYYYDAQGKPSIVKNALSRSFLSLNDGYFGSDESSIFCGKNKLNKANPKTWVKYAQGYFYSKDKYVYYYNRVIKEADINTFEVIIFDDKKMNIPLCQLAKDKDNHYCNDLIITKEEFNEKFKSQEEHLEMMCKIINQGYTYDSLRKTVYKGK